MTDEEYTSIPNTQPFVALIYPLPLVILTTATPIQALELKEEYNKQKWLYLEFKNVEKALLYFIQDAVEDKYTASLVDEYTNLFCNDMPTVIEYLLYNYSKVRYEEVTQKEAEVIQQECLLYYC